MKYVPKERIQLIRERWVAVPTAVDSPSDIAGVLIKQYGLLASEAMGVVHLDIQCKVISVETVATGALTSVSVYLRDFFKGTVLANAAAILMWHNHPNGDTHPSSADIKLTKCIQAAGNVLDIAVLDHIIIGPDGYTSLMAQGYMNVTSKKRKYDDK
jgi:DNA repair protein RadC